MSITLYRAIGLLLALCGNRKQDRDQFFYSFVSVCMCRPVPTYRQESALLGGALAIVSGDAWAHGEALGLVIFPGVLVVAGVFVAALWRGPKWARYVMAFMPLAGYALSLIGFVLLKDLSLTEFMMGYSPGLFTLLLVIPVALVPILFARIVSRVAKRAQS